MKMRKSPTFVLFADNEGCDPDPLHPRRHPCWSASVWSEVSHQWIRFWWFLWFSRRLSSKETSVEGRQFSEDGCDDDDNGVCDDDDGDADANSETLSGRPQSRVASSLKTRSSTTQDGDSLQVWIWSILQMSLGEFGSFFTGLGVGLLLIF